MLSLWAGFAGTVFIPAIQTLLDQCGWRGTLIVLGAINIVFCGGLYAVVIDPAADAPKRIDELRPPPLAGARAVAWALRSPVFWTLAIALTAYWAVFSGGIFHAYPLLIEAGFESQPWLSRWPSSARPRWWADWRSGHLPRPFRSG